MYSLRNGDSSILERDLTGDGNIGAEGGDGDTAAQIERNTRYRAVLADQIGDVQKLRQILRALLLPGDRASVLIQQLTVAPIDAKTIFADAIDGVPVHICSRQLQLIVYHHRTAIGSQRHLCQMGILLIPLIPGGQQI